MTAQQPLSTLCKRTQLSEDFTLGNNTIMFFS